MILAFRMKLRMTFKKMDIICQWGGYPRRTLKDFEGDFEGYFKKSSIGDSKGDYIEDLRMEGDLFNSVELDTE